MLGPSGMAYIRAAVPHLDAMVIHPLNLETQATLRSDASPAPDMAELS